MMDSYAPTSPAMDTSYARTLARCDHRASLAQWSDLDHYTVTSWLDKAFHRVTARALLPRRAAGAMPHPPRVKDVDRQERQVRRQRDQARRNVLLANTLHEPCLTRRHPGARGYAWHDSLCVNAGVRKDFGCAKGASA